MFVRTLLYTFLSCSFISLQAQLKTQRAITTSQAALQLYNTAMSQMRAKDLISAKRSFKQSLEEDNAFTAAMDGLAEVYRVEEKSDSAIAYYKSSLEIFPRNLLGHQNLATIYLLNNKEEEAISQYKTLLRYYQGYPEAYLGLARVYMSRSAYQEALKSAEHAMKIYLAGGRGENASEARWLAGKSYLALDDPKMALKYFKACKKYYKENGFYHYDIGLVYLQMGKTKEAEEHIKHAEEIGYQVPPHIHNKLAFLNDR